MITFIVLVSIGWIISLGTAIKGMIVGWIDKDKHGFYDSFKLLVLSIPGGFVIGWILLGAYVKMDLIDKRFNDDDKPERTKG